MSRETESIYRFTCDSAKCSNTAVSSNALCPVNWLYTNSEDDNSSMRIFRMRQKTPRQIAEIRDVMHFCCTGCFIDYLAEQIGRLDILLNTED